jgi:hypothetical protein
MPLIHWVARQNNLETPKEKDEVKQREVHEVISLILGCNVCVQCLRVCECLSKEHANTHTHKLIHEYVTSLIPAQDDCTFTARILASTLVLPLLSKPPSSSAR